MKTYNFREYNQNQGMFCTIIPADLIDEEHPAFIISKVIEKLDLRTIYDSYSNEGNPSYHPKMMFKVLFYSYYITKMSSRKIRESLIGGRADYLFLSGGQCPDHRTINNFRTRHMEQIPDLFAQVVILCQQLGMINFEHLAIDGQKIEANASFKNSYDFKRVEKRYKKIKMAMEKIAQTPIDEFFTGEKQQARLEKFEKEMKQLDELAKELKKHEESEPKKKLNKTDIEAKVLTHKDNTKTPSYNHQSAVDKKCGVTCAVETLDRCDNSSDLVPLVEKTKATLGEAHQNVSADSAFSSYEMLEEIYTNENITENYLVPDRNHKAKNKKKYYSQEQFEPNEEGIPICPAGKVMRIKQKGNNRTATIYEGVDCSNCNLKTKCTKASKRTIAIDERSIYRDMMREKLETSEGRERYIERQWIVEAGHGDDQKNKKWTQHYLRGKAKAHLEFLLIRIASNIAKIIKYKRIDFLELVQT